MSVRYFFAFFTADIGLSQSRYENVANSPQNFYPFNANGNRGVAVGLGNIQFVKDGDRLSGRASADADFDTLEDDEDVLGGDAGEELPDYLR